MGICILFSIVYGYMEQYVKRNGFRDSGKHVWPGISTNYHLPMLCLFFLVALATDNLWFLPIMLVIEDMAWFIFNPDDSLDKDDWVNFQLGGLRIGEAWIPFTYLIAGAVSYVLWLIF